MSTPSAEFTTAAENLSKAQEALAAAGKKEADRLKREKNNELHKQEAREYAARLARKQHEQKIVETQKFLDMVDPDVLNQATPVAPTSEPTPTPVVVVPPVVTPTVPPAPPAEPVPTAPTAVLPEPQEELGLDKAKVVSTKRGKVVVVIRDYFRTWRTASWVMAIFFLIITELVMLGSYDGFYPGKPDVIRFIVGFIVIPFFAFMIGGLIGSLISRAQTKTKVTVHEEAKPAE